MTERLTPGAVLYLAAGGSAGLLAAAYVFEALGWQPCTMCLWQRWPHFAAMAFGALALLFRGPGQIVLVIGGLLSVLTTAALAGYHTGVERKWWPGPASCSGGGGLGDLSGDQLVPGASQIPALVLCDSFTPFLFGLSMANWNLLASLALALVWAAALKRVSG